MDPKVGIVLVNYNGEKFQNDCIRTIKEMNYNNYEIIIVDNDSNDNSIKIARAQFNNLIIIETRENCGVAKGNNIGIKKALEMNCEYILLLNNDTEVDKLMLSEMMKRADNNVMVTCKMYYYNPNNVIWCAGGKINWNKATTTHYGEGEVDNGQHDNSRFVEYTPTCCLLIHKDVFEKVGLIDEKYFMYYDDTDFLARCNEAGVKTWYEAKAKLWHKVSSSSGGKNSKVTVYYGDRNRLYFVNKFYESKLMVLTYFYITRTIKFLKLLFLDRQMLKVSIKAIRDFKSGNMYRQDL